MGTLPVFFESRVVGTIETDADGARFVYAGEWADTRGAFPISTTMPIKDRVIGPERLIPWIANLIPEGGQLSALSQNLHVSPQDVVAILSEVGRDTAGALSFRERGTTASEWKPVPDEAALERVIGDLPNKPFLAGEDGISISLAGAQAKMAVAVDPAGRINIPLNGSPSTHILKPDIPRLWGSVYNEALCLVLAGRCGLRAPRVATGRAGERSYFLIERYDRIAQGDRVRRIHQEDFCQALGKFPASKYQKNQSGIPGPDVPQMIDLARRQTGIPGILQFADNLIFNVISCNTDAHGKNYSLIIQGGGVRMAPIYDVMCSPVWESVTKNLANTVGGKNRGDYLKGRHWEREAVACKLKPSIFVARVEALANRVLKEIDAAAEEVRAMPAGDSPMIAMCVDAIRQRASYLVAGLHERSDAQEPDEPAIGETGRRHDAFAP